MNVLTYVLFIAICNICLGYILGCVSRRCFVTHALDGGASRRNASFIGNANTTAPVPLVSADTQLAPPADAEGATAEGRTPGDDEQEASDTKRAPATWVTPKSWSDFGQQLQTIKDRIRYARSARDMQLAKDASTQLHACAGSWAFQLQRCLDGEAPELQSELIRNGEDATNIEFCLAQFETSISNLESLDWTEEVVELLDQLEREASALKKWATH